MLKKTLCAVLLSSIVCAAVAAVDINKADQAELETVKGIGPSLSQRILDERAKGVFKDWADVVGRVPGVGAGSAARLSRGGLTVGGSGYAGAAPPPRRAGAAPAASSSAAQAGGRR